MSMDLFGARVGVALTGSFCTFEMVFRALRELEQAGAELFPILSFHVRDTDTRFFTREQVLGELRQITGREVWQEITQVEPIGPKKLLDLLLIAPCTGNTLAKLARGIADTPVTMAAKSQLRNERPVLLGVSTNDGLAANAQSIGALQARKHIFFVPYGQDDPEKKPASLVFDEHSLLASCRDALAGKQTQPMLRVYDTNSKH